MFKHIDIELPKLERETIDGVRYYSIPDEEELLRLVSITSVTSHFNKEIFVNWRKKVGDEEADRVTKAATSRGTDMHTLVENYLYNRDLPSVQPLSDFLFKISKTELNRINNIYALEGSLYSKQLGIAGTVDCIAEYDGELQSTSNFSQNTLESLLEINWNSMEPNKELEQAIENKFLTPSKFALEIEKIVAEENFNYIDAIVHYCEINSLEVESVTKLISKPLKERLKWDATRLNFMKRTSKAKLPL